MTTNELPFRIALGVLLIVGWTVRIHSTRKARVVSKVRAVHKVREGISNAVGNLSYALTLVYLFTDWFAFAHIPVPNALRWAGALVVALGIWLLLCTHRTLGSNWSPTLELSKGHELVVCGPYRLVRHPMYVAFFSFGVGITLLSANWLVGGAILGSITYVYLVRVRDEEAMMVEHFGAAYRHYMVRTGRLLPRLRR